MASSKETLASEPLMLKTRVRKRRSNFIERTLASFAGKMESALDAEELAKTNGLLQRLDPRVKVVGLLNLTVAAALAHRITIILAIFAVALVLAFLSRVPVRTLVTRVWFGALLFTGTIALPAIFIAPGRILLRVPLLDWPITEQGIRSALFLITRVETSATLSVLLILTTRWTHVLKALRVLRVPVVFVVILGMTYRYIFLMLATARSMFESRRSRTIGVMLGAERRRIAAASVGVLMGKTFQLSNEVYLAMQSRGFRGEVYTLDEFQMLPRDWLALVLFILIAVFAFWFGR
ncbi:MAG: cobalt ECF transporter T component CbiQ [Pyrinomonadaceae bacterium]